MALLLESDRPKKPPFKVYIDPTPDELDRFNGSLMDYKFDVGLNLPLSALVIRILRIWLH